MPRRIFCVVMCCAILLLLGLTDSSDAAKPGCGDEICGPKETYENCPLDCPPPSVCGDGTCNPGEDPCSCPADCSDPSATEISCDDDIDNDCDGLVDCNDADCVGNLLCPCNNDGTCNLGEDCDNCPSDCPSGQNVTGSCDPCFKGVCDGVCNPRKEGSDCPDCGGGVDPFCCGSDFCEEALCGPNCGFPPPPPPVCGNGLTEAGEECDDGNTTPGDGCDENCLNEISASVPQNQFNIGDSIGEGEAADGTIGEAHHDLVWSTGYNGYDSVYSLNERLEDVDPTDYYENDANRDSLFNKAVSGSVMSDFVAQANQVVAASNQTPTGKIGMVTILLGNNDLCAKSLDLMTDPTQFEAQYRAGLDILAASPATKDAEIHVSGIPAIYWLWVAKKDSAGCRFIWYIGGVCQALLQNPADDCASSISRDNPDTIYPGDGTDCLRRKEFHRRIKDVYNPILQDVLQEYVKNGRLPNARYVDIFDVKFTSTHVNNGDCFHPSTAGHAYLANEEWCRSGWGIDDPVCNQ